MGSVSAVCEERSCAANAEIAHFGIAVDDVTRPIATLSGGERQSVAIARAIHFGTKVLILDEPTSALGVRESEIVLRFIHRARGRDIGIVFITHNVHRAWLIGDTFEILKRGRASQAFEKAEISKDRLLIEMAGGEDLNQLEAALSAN
jgi:simple sugar transport system ATP-binding protein